MSSRVVWIIPELESVFKVRIQKRSNLIPTIHLLARVTLHLAVLVALYFCLDRKSYLLVIILILLNGFLTSFLGWAGAGHEYFHSTAFTNGKFNTFLFRAFSCMSFNNWGWFEVSHLLHHKNTLHLNDPEGPAKKSTSVLNLFWLLTIDLPGFGRRLRILSMNLLGIVPTQNEVVSNVLKSKPKLQKRIKTGATWVLACQISIFLFGFFLNPAFGLVLLLSSFTFTFANKIMELNQHLGMKTHSNDYRENSRTFRFNFFLEFLYSNMNFHAEHHMYSSVPYYNLPKLHKNLLNKSEIIKPDKGLWAAGRIALRTGLSEFESKDCLSCFLDCSKKTNLVFD